MPTSVATQIYSRPEEPKLIPTEILLKKWFLQTFVYLKIRFMLFKMAWRGWKGWKHQKLPKKTPFLKYGIIKNSQ